MIMRAASDMVNCRKVSLQAFKAGFQAEHRDSGRLCATGAVSVAISGDLIQGFAV